MTRLERVEAVLGQLSTWEREYGTRFSDDPRLRSRGESNAAIAEFKGRLNQLGARYHWQASSRRYLLDSIGPPPGSEGQPE